MLTAVILMGSLVGQVEDPPGEGGTDPLTITENHHDILGNYLDVVGFVGHGPGTYRINFWFRHKDSFFLRTYEETLFFNEDGTYYFDKEELNQPPGLSGIGWDVTVKWSQQVDTGDWLILHYYNEDSIYYEQ